MKKRACDSCYKKKIQCDGAVPKCDWCHHHNLPCTFDRPISSRRKGNNVEQVEQAPGLPSCSADGSGHGIPVSGSLALPCQVPDRSSGSDSPAPSHGAQESGKGRLRFAGRHLGDISMSTHIPFLSAEGQKWIQSRTGESTAAIQALCASGPPWQVRHGIPQSFLSPGATMDLPSRRLVDECLWVYSVNPFRRIFPAIDIVLFQGTIDSAYSVCPAIPSLESVASKACVFSFLALTSLHNLCRTAMPLVDGEECAVKAQHLLLQLLHETTIVSLQTCVMLGLYHLLLGQLEKAAIFQAVACRMITTLRANTAMVPPPISAQADDGIDFAWKTRNQLRKLFWLCYWYDKEIAVRTGLPPCINDDDCDLTLPQGYLDVKYVENAPATPLLEDTALPLLLGDVRLEIIKSKTYKLLYSAKALRKSDVDLILDIRMLDDELEEWRTSVPPKFRPSLSFRESQAPLDLSDLRTTERIMVHFEYHHLVAKIHGATGRCRSWDNPDSYELEGVSSSLALAVETSRSTLFYLRAIVHALTGEVFWMAVFYPISAIMTIFCNILYNPLHMQADTDLELLTSAPHLINEMRMRRFARNEAAHLKMLGDFVAELARLAKSAIAKTREEQDGVQGLMDLDHIF